MSAPIGFLGLYRLYRTMGSGVWRSLTMARQYRHFRPNHEASRRLNAHIGALMLDAERECYRDLVSRERLARAQDRALGLISQRYPGRDKG